MGLFDNIFLDKDTPTALLDNPEIKAPPGEVKKEKEETAYDPKNDPIAPAIEDKTEEGSSTNESSSALDVSFDIGGDLDFSNIGTEVEPKTEEKSQGTEEAPMTEGASIPGDTAGTEGDVSSIAMIQGGTASVVDSIDIGGTDTASQNTSPEIHIEIHGIEDHEVVDASSTSGGEGGIYGFMEKSIPSESDALAQATTEEKVEPIEDKKEAEVASFTDLDTFGGSADTTMDAAITPLVDMPVEYTAKSERGGRIQELIGKLINELKILDEEEQKLEDERRTKLTSIEAREKELEHEYLTRKEALKYERASLEQPLDKTSEKERIKSLISSFEEDLG